MKLAGKVAFVTGASRGIGKCVALTLAREGCDVAIVAKTEEPDPRLPGTIHDTKREVEALGRRACAVKCDVRDTDQIAAAVKEAERALGKVDILVNNAGALWWKKVQETPPKRFDLVMGVNARAAFFCAQAVLPGMIERRWGHIVNMSPPIDLRVVPGRIAYFISKYGMTLLSYGLAEEVREENVAVNSLWPVTVIESQATINYGLGDPSVWRKADILADATLAIVTKEPSSCTGNAFLDEEVLRADGVTDFAKYSCVPGGQPLDLMWAALGGAVGGPPAKG